MKHEVKENTQQQIIRILRTRGPKRLSELAPILRKSPSTIKYHLESLSDRGIVVANQTKLYRVAEEGDIEKAILEAIVKYGKQKKSDLLSLEELAAFGEQLSGAFQNLVTKGLLVERDEMTELTRWGIDKLGVCYVCYKPIAGLSTVSFVTDILYEYAGQKILGDVPGQVTAVLIHPKCFSKLANELVGEYSAIPIPEGCFCDYCGLPLSIGLYKMLVENIGVSTEEIRSHLLKYEREIAGKMKKPWPFFTSREEIEELMMVIEEEAKKGQKDYDRQTRERELWSTVQSIMKEKKDRLDEIIHKLFDPIGIAYSRIPTPWEHPTEEDIITTDKESLKYAPQEANFSMVFVGEKGERLHPFCARMKLGIGATQTPQGEAIREQKDSPYGGVGK